MTSAPMRQRMLDGLSLFGSLSTLLCCALPSVLVLFGLGATVASVLSAAPWLVALSRHKQWVFAISGVLIAANFAYVYVYVLAPRLRASSSQTCDTGAPSACADASKVSRGILWVSAGLYVTGFFVAFALGPLLARLES